jgi:hypothetical protein
MGGVAVMEGLTFDATVSLSLLLSLATIVFSWWRTREDRSAKAVADVNKLVGNLKDDLGALKSRVTDVERTIGDKPGSNDMHALTLALSEMRGELREIRAVMGGNQKIMERVENIVARHEDHLLTKG